MLLLHSPKSLGLVTRRRAPPPVERAGMAPLTRASPVIKFTQLVSALDPALLPALRAFLVGYACSTGPAVLKIVLGLVTRKRGDVLGTLRTLGRALLAGFSLESMGWSAAVSVGGAKWGESRVEPLVRAWYEASLARKRGRRAVKNRKGGLVAVTEEKEHSHRLARGARHEANIAALSTMAASTVSSLLAITLLQASPRNRRPAPSPLNQSTSTFNSTNFVVAESPTLNLTMFLLVRALDSVVRGTFEATATKKGKTGQCMSLVASQADTLLFAAACWRIMVRPLPCLQPT